MNFFGHDSNASNDPRIKKLLTKYGYEGTGLYWHMIELISRHLDPPREQSCILQEDVDVLAYDGHIQPTQALDIVNFMIDIGLFEKSECGKLKNIKVLRRLSDAQKKKIRRTLDGQPSDNRRTNDGLMTDNVRCEVNRSEVEVKRIELNQKLNQKADIIINDNITPKERIKISHQIDDLYKFLDKSNLSNNQISEAKSRINELETKLLS